MRRSRAGTLARIVLTPVVVWAIYLLKVNVWFRLYPAVMVAVAFAVFAVSLFRTPLVEVFARGMGETLDARGTAYCRRVTRVWTGFLAAHLVLTVLTLFAPDRVWAVYNGFVAYVLMGALFLGERVVRRRVRRG